MPVGRTLASVLLLAIAARSRAAEPSLAERQRDAAAAGARAIATRDWAAAEAAWREAARLAADRLRAEPDDFDLAAARDAYEYNAACGASLAGRTDAAFELLEALVARPWHDNDDLLANDADLAPLRVETRRFEALVARERAVLAAATAGHAEGEILVPDASRATARRLPLVVALHGGGGNVESWREAWQAVADRAGVVVVLVRGSRVQGVGSFSYHQRDPARDAARIESWIARARERCPTLDEDDSFLAGFSQGGGMAWVLGLTGARAWRGVIPLGAYVQLAARARVLEGEPVRPLAAFSLVGEHDEEAIQAIARAMAARDGTRSLRVRLEVVPGAGHGLPPDLPGVVQRAMRWCRKATAARPAR